VPAAVSGSLQGDHVFATTLRDNVRLVAPDAGDLDLDLAADRVGLGDWVRELPDGWSTQAGADGSRLSGGQRQRLLLMRALLADTPILILDEPTAHLDAVTERAVMADLIDSTVGRTLVLSTHRLALLDPFDLCVTIEDRCLRPARRPRSDEDLLPSPDRWAVAAAGRR
jgi:ABC-type transport system involved in cytochrome bd biosynthesis fused ATPase/permease subunit